MHPVGLKLLTLGGEEDEEGKGGREGERGVILVSIHHLLLFNPNPSLTGPFSKMQIFVCLCGKTNDSGTGDTLKQTTVGRDEGEGKERKEKE